MSSPKRKPRSRGEKFPAGNFTSLTATKWLQFASTGAASTSNAYWANTEPTASVISVGSHTDVNNSGDDHILYAWAEIPGYSRMGFYTGNASTNGPFVWCGFRPAWVLIKRIDTTGPWQIQDSTRWAVNTMAATLFANTTEAEAIGLAAYETDFLANGFKVRSSTADRNASGGTYIFVAFAEAPFKYARAR